MKKLFLSLTMLCVTLCAVADKGAMVLTSPPLFQLNAVSPNGKWACGTTGDGVYTILQGVLWNLETGEFTHLSSIDQSGANDVADDGTVVGYFTDYSMSGNGNGVSVAGYYKDGEWKAFDNTTLRGVSSFGGEAYSISADGRQAVGYAMKGGDYIPVKWEDGQLELIYKYEHGDGICYAISRDGQYASGWAYTPDFEGDLNRTIALWTDEDVQYLSPGPTFVEAGRAFSPDNTWLLCDSFGKRFIYNTKTFGKIKLEWYSPDCWGQSISYVSNSGLVLGGEEFRSEYGGGNVGLVWIDGQPQLLTDWLKETHNVEIDLTEHSIVRGVDMSDDGKVIAALDYPRSAGGSWASVVVLLDREVDYCPPVALKATKERGVNNVRLTWNEPLMNATNVIGYNIYRDGQLIIEGTSERAYIDPVPSKGTYTYTVSALYEGSDEEFVESEQSTAVTIEVGEDVANPVRNIESHGICYNDLMLHWITPESNLPSVSYFDATEQTAGFGGGLISFSTAIRIPFDIVNNYADNFMVSRVSFMPRNTEAIYTIKVYVNNVEKASQTVDNAQLEYGNMNTFDLNTPVSFKENDDILVAIDVDASHFTAASNDVIGMCYGDVVTGYSDLLRQLVEPEYYSLNQSSIESGLGEMPVCWAITAVFAPIGENGTPSIDSDLLVGYDVYRDNQLLGSATTTYYTDNNVPTGRHTYGIVAKYNNGSESLPANHDINFQPKVEALPAIEDVTIYADLNFYEASWDTPVNNDRTIISYANGDRVGNGMTMAGATELIEYTVAHEYPASFFKWYEGYNIEALRFYPCDEALFAIALEVNDIDQEMIVLGEMNAEDGYTLDAWNTIKLSKPYKIQTGDVVRVKLICSDVDPTTKPIRMDNSVGSTSFSDLYSWDYSHFSSAHIDGGLSGSWMLGMVITNDNTDLLPVKGYHVVVDGVIANEELISDTHFRMEDVALDPDNAHRMRINAVYDVDGGIEVKGELIIFNIMAGVEEITIDRVKVYPNPATSYINVEGDCDRLSLIDMSGRTVAESENNEINVTSLPTGNYLLNVYRNDAVETVKVVIAR